MQSITYWTDQRICAAWVVETKGSKDIFDQTNFGRFSMLNMKESYQTKRQNRRNITNTVYVGLDLILTIIATD